MRSKTFPRYLVGAWRLLLCALLVAALGPVARVRSAPPGGGFTDLGALGLPAVEHASVAWGDYDGDGDLELLVAGCDLAYAPGWASSCEAELGGRVAHIATSEQTALRGRPPIEV